MTKPNEQFWRDKKVYVTGHTGFKGSWLTIWLDKMGAQVTGFALEPNTVPSIFNELCLQTRCRSINANINDYKKLRDSIFDSCPDVIIHMAAQPIVADGYSDPKNTFQTNVIGTVNVLEVAREISWDCRVLVVSSDKCYENNEIGTAFKVGDSLGGHDPYSASKACTEIVTNAYRNSFFTDKNVHVASARAGNVIGGGDWSSDRLIPDAARAFSNNETLTIRNPNATRPWQHVLEPIFGYLKLIEALETNAALRAPFNFGPLSDGAATVKNVVEIFCEAWGDGKRYEISPQQLAIKEAELLTLDCNETFNKLNWHPKLNLTNSIQWTANWYKFFYNNPSSSALKEFTLSQISEYEAI